MMQSILPPLGSRAYSTRRRDITSPRALNAAIYQSTMTRQSADRHGIAPTKTSQKFVDDVNDFIQQSLMTARNKNDEFKIYQQAFDLLIEKFDQQSPAMVIVKKGYDDLIEDLVKQSQKGQQHRLVVQRSMTSLNNALQVKQTAFEKKKKGFADLLDSLNHTIADLKIEIVELHETVRKETKTLRKKTASANKTQNVIHKICKKIQKRADTKKAYQDSIKDNVIKREQLEKLAVDTQRQLTEVLNSISNSNMNVAHTEISIREIEAQIEEYDMKIKQRNDLIVQKAEEKEILRNEAKVIGEDSQKVLEEMDELSRNLKIALSSRGVSGHTLTMVGDDPVKLVALAISKKNKFEGGIDPEMFPDLA
ncbi:hypothetical protein TRFO_04262 [Tritrichomonas foetus]|uniref:Translin-associated factor X-interacting protein 1 N-terminal domain-containing protein n=1 Tax=Tritrichomonas foetus TaxID=1144522 RepID=A0A1J4KFQ6_9EUKA|nr:hypothetical protein TRFO_04262 [Tritrichomonas foetus]|eukprot:OHT10255.1 hypothetical protein TRFO_04262 [Tritrichomonas foetus]